MDVLYFFESWLFFSTIIFFHSKNWDVIPAIPEVLVHLSLVPHGAEGGAINKGDRKAFLALQLTSQEIRVVPLKVIVPVRGVATAMGTYTLWRNLDVGRCFCTLMIHGGSSCLLHLLHRFQPDVCLFQQPAKAAVVVSRGDLSDSLCHASKLSSSSRQMGWEFADRGRLLWLGLFIKWLNEGSTHVLSIGSRVVDVYCLSHIMIFI